MGVNNVVQFRGRPVAPQNHAPQSPFDRLAHGRDYPEVVPNPTKPDPNLSLMFEKALRDYTSGGPTKFEFGRGNNQTFFRLQGTPFWRSLNQGGGETA
jgi:hypothetical protein